MSSQTPSSDLSLSADSTPTAHPSKRTKNNNNNNMAPPRPPSPCAMRPFEVCVNTSGLHFEGTLMPGKAPCNGTYAMYTDPELATDNVQCILRCIDGRRVELTDDTLIGFGTLSRVHAIEPVALGDRAPFDPQHPQSWRLIVKQGCPSRDDDGVFSYEDAADLIDNEEETWAALERHSPGAFIPCVRARPHLRRGFTLADAAAAADNIPPLLLSYDGGPSVQSIMRDCKGVSAVRRAFVDCGSNGSSGNSRFARLPLSRKFVVAMALQIAEKLMVIEDIGHVHGDVKPANILVDHCETSGVLTFSLIDFGLATPVAAPDEAVDRMVSPMYSPLFRPPEMSAPAHWLRSHADVFALGVTIMMAMATPGQQAAVFAGLGSDAPADPGAAPVAPSSSEYTLRTRLFGPEWADAAEYASDCRVRGGGCPGAAPVISGLYAEMLATTQTHNADILRFLVEGDGDGTHNGPLSLDCDARCSAACVARWFNILADDSE